MNEPDNGTEEESELFAMNKRIQELEHLLGLAWGAIQEAGYEDFDFELRDKIEKYL
tara:strand:+ start:3745 stop:3912 length:168 start_codon:yes stop_codon:yes gene_type:complete